MELSPFQIKANDAIQQHKHVLITAHTGSGKTLPAQFAIEYFTKQNKKVIYTSPIKSLSNQKYNDFTKQYKDLSVGILTGDNKHNPEGNLLIMTTEILQNQLLRQYSKTNSYLDFNMDIEKELGCVIFDEVHYINDEDRGTIWEQTMMLLPNQVQMVMLSATIGNPEYLIQWLSEIKQREVVLCSTSHRVVPLEFYQYFTCSEKEISKLPKEQQSTIIKHCNQLNPMNESNLMMNDKCMKYLKSSIINRKYVLNQLCEQLREKEMFPALFFVFSRKQVELMSNEITFPLFQHNEKDYNIRHVCKQLIVSRVSNWKEYVMLPEYEHYVNLLEKGIGLHHAGMLPIFREMIEILYTQKYIKVLFATETFAIGLNMPTKTVCFSDVSKHDGKQRRLLYNHEFKQMCGRAGRRNIDKIGYVIILSNLIRDVQKSNYLELLENKENNIKSKFKVNYSYILHKMEHFTQEENIKFIEKSLMYVDIKKNIDQITTNLEENKKNVEELYDTNFELCIKHQQLSDSIYMAQNKKKKQIKKEMKDIEENPQYMEAKENFPSYQKHLMEKNKNTYYLDYAKHFIEYQVNSIYDILNKNDFNHEQKRNIALRMNEIHPLIFSDLYIKTNGFECYSTSNLYALLSCFYELKNDEYPKIQDLNIDFILQRCTYYQEMETKYELSSMNQYNIQYAMYDYIQTWMNFCDNEQKCIQFINQMKEESGIFIGDFVKCCLKLIHISHELETICDSLSDYNCLQKVKQGKSQLMKFIMTNQSLYL